MRHERTLHDPGGYVWMLSAAPYPTHAPRSRNATASWSANSRPAEPRTLFARVAAERRDETHRRTDMLARRAAALAAAIAAAGGCANVARIENASDAVCRDAIATGLATILAQQGEAPDIAGRLAKSAAANLALADFGPRPFMVSSSSGTDYEFFVESKQKACLLRLYGRQKGFRSYVNDITYIATEPLPGCVCRDE
jgi:metal-dependent amidase/aminoacylase/carboxypeptidase family protein